MTQPLAPRVYVTTDANAEIRAIANVSNSVNYPGRDGLLVSYDRSTFHTVLFNSRQSGPGYYHGIAVQPALNIHDIAISFADGEMTYDGVTYVLDEDATIGQIITKPIMRIVEVVQTYAGYYVTAQNQLDGRSHDYLNGQPLQILSGIRARSSDLVAETQYAGHRYLVTGDHMDTSQQTATFDGQPATPLDPKDYDIVFTDDLTTCTVTPKK